MHLISSRREKNRRFRKMSENGEKKGLTTRLGYDMIKNNLKDAPCTEKQGVVKVSTGTVKPVKHVEFAYTLQKGRFKIKRRQ